ncbi:hypothetical protein O6H91_Y099100 [Diphasiastrum complanatum]|nr:hypothetical protein O6H91_Y099100 [Diphasiastrum complanatum]
MWGDPEVSVLLDVFQEKWFALCRGNLSAEHWKWIAEKLGGRYKSLQGRTGLQCKSKIEKMRTKFRKEKKLFDKSGVPSKWKFFDQMANLCPDLPRGSDDCLESAMHAMEAVMDTPPSFHTQSPTPLEAREQETNIFPSFVNRRSSVNTPTGKKMVCEREMRDAGSPKAKISRLQDLSKGNCVQKTRNLRELVDLVKSFTHQVLQVELSKIELLKDMAREQQELAREQRELAREQRESHERMITLVLQTIMSIQETKDARSRSS